MSLDDRYRLPPQRPWTLTERVGLWLARHLHMFRYYGLRGMQPRWWPTARVWYPDMQRYSRIVPMGNAYDHAEATGGYVVPSTGSL